MPLQTSNCCMTKNKKNVAQRFYKQPIKLSVKCQYNMIQKIHHEVLKVLYEYNKYHIMNYYKSTKSPLFTIGISNLWSVPVYKQFKLTIFVVLSSFKDIIYNTKNGPLSKLPTAISTYFGINTVLFQAFLTWNSLPYSIKSRISLPDLKPKIKNKVNCIAAVL